MNWGADFVNAYTAVSDVVRKAREEKYQRELEKGSSGALTQMMQMMSADGQRKDASGNLMPSRTLAEYGTELINQGVDPRFVNGAFSKLGSMYAQNQKDQQQAMVRQYVSAMPQSYDSVSAANRDVAQAGGRIYGEMPTPAQVAGMAPAWKTDTIKDGSTDKTIVIDAHGGKEQYKNPDNVIGSYRPTTAVNAGYEIVGIDRNGQPVYRVTNQKAIDDSAREEKRLGIYGKIAESTIEKNSQKFNVSIGGKNYGLTAAQLEGLKKQHSDKLTKNLALHNKWVEEHQDKDASDSPYIDSIIQSDDFLSNYDDSYGGDVKTMFSGGEHIQKMFDTNIYTKLKPLMQAGKRVSVTYYDDSAKKYVTESIDPNTREGKIKFAFSYMTDPKNVDKIVKSYRLMYGSGRDAAMAYLSDKQWFLEHGFEDESGNGSNSTGQVDYAK